MMTATQRLTKLALAFDEVPDLGEGVARTIPNLLQRVLSGHALSGAQMDFLVRLSIVAAVDLLTEPDPVSSHRAAIGRHVHYVLAGTDSRNGHVRPAIITHIHSETCLNLCVIADPNDEPISREAEIKVFYSALETPGTWHWPNQTARKDVAAPPSQHEAEPTRQGGNFEVPARHQGQCGTAPVLGGTQAASAERMHDTSPEALAADPSPIPNPDTACS